MKTQKGIIHLGLIIILLIFGVGALVFVMYKTNSLPVVTTSSPTPNSTPAPITTPEGWMEYDLPEISLTFFYPADAKVDTKSSHTLGVGSKYQGPMLVNISKYGQTQGLDTELYDGYSLSIAKIALNSESLQKIAQDSISFNTSEFGQETLIKPLSTITIGGKTGYTYTIQSLGKYTHILLPLDEKSFLLITYSAPDPNNQGYQKIIDQILSTFEFVQDTSNWKTLSYKKFSMKYPSQWQTVDPNNASLFPLKERFSFSANNFKALVLNKKDIYLIISIEDEYDGGAGGIFLNDDYYQEFTSTQDEVKIGDSTFYIGRSSNKIPELKVSHGGPYTWSFLSEYLPQKKTVSGNIKGYENVIKRNGYMYNFVLASIEGGLTDQQTQQELIYMLKTINW